MHSHTMPRTLAASAVIVAAGLVLLLRSPGEQTGSEVAEPIRVPAAERPVPTPAAAEQPTVAAAETPAAVKIRELEAMSETFRNTTFLIAIRDAGFVCNDLLRVHGGFDDSAKWLVTCSEMLAYPVGVAGDGTVHAEPFQQYFDGVGPRVIEQQFDTPPQPAQPLR